MNNFMVLLKGEFQRLIKYNIVQVGFGVSVLWVLVLFLIGRDQAADFVPLFIFMDAALMTILLIGAGLFYERQENTLKSLMITPSKMGHIIASKLVSAVYIALQSALFIGLLAYFFFDATVNFAYLLPFTLLIALSHAIIGYTIAVLVEDFPTLLATLMLYMIVFAFPSIFYALDLFGGLWEIVLVVSPTHASFLLIDFAFGHDVSTTLIVVSALYLLLLAFLLARYVVFPKYIEKAVRE